MLENYPALALLPPLIAIVMVIASKRVLLSLGLGILSAALLIENFHPLQTLTLLFKSFAAIFWDFEVNSLNSYNLYILLFLLMLGIITSMVMMSGGTFAFANWFSTKIKSRQGAQLASVLMGIAIFVDDYFNALAVGQIARPITDKHNISRAKLAYLVDSTSAPVAVLMPLSSWGASIIGIMAPIIALSNLQITDAFAFIVAACLNYYAIVALVLIIFVVIFRLDIGPMRTEENRALVHHQLYEPNAVIPGQIAEDLPRHTPGAKRALMVPFILLILGVLAGMILTGYDGENFSPLEILANTNVNIALNLGGFLGLISAIYYYFRYTRANQKFTPRTFRLGVVSGTGSMLPAIYILILAWVLGGLISELGTGQYLAQLVEGANLTPNWLIPLMFIIAAIMAFSTGTSWGSFGILLPLAGEILLASGSDHLLLASFGAVLAGAVLGDHCSPISDTTILSSTGAGANIITHVSTQLPYALLGAVAALIGYVLLALSGSAIIGLLGALISVLIIATILRIFFKPLAIP